jgi:MFS family permease
MIVPFLFLLVISPVAGFLYDKFGSRRLCLIGMSVLMLSLVSLLTVQPFVGVSSLLWRLGLAGIGTALYVSPNNTVIMSSIPPYRRGIASGAVATARNIGMVMGVALAGLIFSASFSALAHGSGLENYTAAMELSFLTSFRRAMMTGVVLSVMGIGVTLVRDTESK